MFTAKIYITLKEGVLDPQGGAVMNSLHTMGYQSVNDVRVGKYMLVSLAADNRDEASKQVDEMCAKLLANPVIENYTFEFVEG